MERRAWQALHDAGRSIVQFKKDTGNWPRALDEVTDLPVRQFNDVPFQYDAEKHTLVLHAFFEKNPIKLITRGRYGESKKSGDFTVNLETIDMFNIGKSDIAPSDYFFKNNITSVIVTSEVHRASDRKR